MANYFGIQWPDPPDDEQRPYTPVPIQQQQRQQAKAPAGVQGRFQPPVTPTVPTPPVYQQDRWESAPREVYPQDRWEAAPQAQPPMRDRWESAPTPPQRPYLPMVTQQGTRQEAMPPLVAAAPPVGGLPIVQAATRILPKLWEQRDEWAEAAKEIVQDYPARVREYWQSGQAVEDARQSPVRFVKEQGQRALAELLRQAPIDLAKLPGPEDARPQTFLGELQEANRQGEIAPLNLPFYLAMRAYETTGESLAAVEWQTREQAKRETGYADTMKRVQAINDRLGDPRSGLTAQEMGQLHEQSYRLHYDATEKVLLRQRELLAQIGRARGPVNAMLHATEAEKRQYRTNAPMGEQFIAGFFLDPLNAFELLGPALKSYRVSRAAKELAPAYPTIKTAGGVLRPATSAEAKAATVAKLSKYNAVNQRLGPLAAFIPWRHTPQTMGEQLVNRTINATNRMLDGLPKTADGGIDLNLLQKAVADPHAPDIVAATAGYSQSAEWLDTAVVIDRALGVTPEATDAVATAQRAKIAQVEEQVAATQKAIAETTAQIEDFRTQGKSAQQINRATNRLTKQQNSLANQQKHLDNLKAQVQQPGRVDFAGLIKLAQQPDSDSLTIAAELARQYADAAESFFPTTGKGLGRQLVNARDRFNNSILSTALLGTNPGYAFRNAANNLVTALVDGVNPYQSAEDLRALWVRWGAPPVQTKQGIGPGDAFKNRATTAEYLQNLATPLRMRDTFNPNGRKWRDYTRAVAANWEAYASERIVAHHIQTYFPQTWGGYLKELRKQIVQAGQLDETQATQITRLWASKLNRTELHEAIDAMTGPSRPRVTPQNAPPTAPPAPGAAGWGTRPGAKKPYGTEPAPAPVLDLARTLSEDEAAQLVAEAGPGADTLARELLQAGPAAQRVFVDVLVPAQERSAQLAAHVNTLAGQTYTPGQRASLQQFLEDVQGVIETAKDNDDAMRQGVFEAAQNVTEAERTLIFREWRRARDTARRELYRRLDALEEARMPELGFDEQAITNSRTHRQFIADAWARSDRVIENYWTGKGKGISQDYEAVNKERRRIWTDVQNRIKLRAEQWDADLDRAVAKSKGSAVTAAPEPPAPDGMPMFISKARRQELYDLGYNKADVDAMTPAEGQAIAQAQRTKPAPVTAAPVGAEPPAPAPTAAQPVTAAPDAGQISRISAKARELGIPSASDRNVGTGAQGAMWDQHALNIARQRFPGEIRPDSKAFRSLQKATPDELNLVEQALDERLAERAAPRVDVPPAAGPEVAPAPIPPTAPDPRKPWETPSIRIERARRGTRLPVPGQPSTRVPFGKEPSAPAVGPTSPSQMTWPEYQRYRISLLTPEQQAKWAQRDVNGIAFAARENVLQQWGDDWTRLTQTTGPSRAAYAPPAVTREAEFMGPYAPPAIVGDYEARALPPSVFETWDDLVLGYDRAPYAPPAMTERPLQPDDWQRYGVPERMNIAPTPPQVTSTPPSMAAASAAPEVERPLGVKVKLSDHRAYERAGDYSLDQLERDVIPNAMGLERYGYIQNWFDRAQKIVTAPGRTDRAEWIRRWNRNRQKWADVLEPTGDVAPAPSVAAPGKQPWEMTRAEWVEEVRNGRDFKQLGTQPTPLSRLRGARDYETLDAQALKNHEGAVITAFTQGQPVPPQVLAEYPELQRASGASVTPPTSAGAVKPAKPELVGYEWRTTKGEKWSNYEGGIVGAKVSDWDRSLKSERSGRDIVHIYWIRGTDGQIRPYGKVSALNELGYDTTQLDRKANKFVQEAMAKKAADEGALDEFTRAKKYASAEEARKEFKFNTVNSSRNWGWGTPQQHLDEALKQVREATTYEKDGKYITVYTGGTKDKGAQLAEWQRIDPVSAPAAAPQPSVTPPPGKRVAPTDIRNRVLGFLSDGKQHEFGELYRLLGYDRPGYMDDVTKHPVNAELIKMRDEGLITSEKPGGWGESLIALNKTPAPAPTAPTTPRPLTGPTGNTVTAYGTDPNRVYEFRYRVAELDDLIASQSDAMTPNPQYPAELQPRIRDRAASQVQVTNMAQNLQPDGLLGNFNSLDRGAMIVGPDAVVESGNGRVLALRQVRAAVPEKWQAYQARLREVAPEYGIDPAQLDSLKAPVLVRERVTDVDRVRFTAEANEQATLAMSPVETALQDAGRVQDDLLATLQVGDNQSVDQALTSAQNWPIIKAFLAAIPANERAALATAEGGLNALGLARLKGALFAKTYPGDAGQRLAQTFIESLDPSLKNIEAGMFASLPRMSRAESLVRSGERAAELAFGDDLAAAVDVLSRLKEQGIRVDDYLSQMSMFDDELTPFQKEVLQYLDSIGRSPKKVRESLNAYADAVEAAPRPGQMGLLADPVGITKEDILGRIRETQANAPTEQAGLWGTERIGQANPPAFGAQGKGLEKPTFGQQRLGIVAPGTQEAFAVMDAATAAARRVADFFTNRRVAAQPVKPLTPEQAAWLHKFADDFAAPKQMKAKAIASNIAVKMRNFALGDYADRRNIHEWLTWLYPYAYWYTFTYPNWARRIMQHPAILSNYARYKQAVREQNREYYRDMMGDPNAEPPEYWNYQLRIPLGDTSLYFNLERNLNPLVQLVESFKQTAKSAAPAFPWNAQTPADQRGFFQSGDFIQALGDFGPSISPPLIYAYALWLASQGYTEAAQQWVGGYLTPVSRLMRPVTAAIREKIPATGAVIPPGGWSPEMLILDFMKRGGDYWQQRSGIPAALVDLYRTNKATATEVENAAWSRDVWDSKWGDAAQANALKTLAPVFASWLLGQGFKPTDITDVQIQQMWDDKAALTAQKGTLSKEDYNAAWEAFKEKYPWFNVFMLARSQDPVERLDAFTDLVLDRLPPAGPRRQQMLTDAGMPPELMDRYYSDKYSTANFTPEERAQFELAIEKLAGTVDVPDAATQATYDAARSENQAINAAAAAAAGVVLAQVQATEQQYYDIKDAQGEAAAKAFLAQHPELEKYWDEKKIRRAQGSDTYREFYGKPTDRGLTEALQQFGETEVRFAQAYLDMTPEQRTAWNKANPGVYRDRIAPVLDVMLKYNEKKAGSGAGSAGAQREALYDKGRAEAVQQYGEAGVREAEAYNDLDDAQSAAFRQQNPEAYNRIKEVNRAIFKYLPSNYTGSTSRTTYSGGSSYSGGRSYSSGGRSYGSAPAAPVAPVTVTPQQPAQPEWQNWQESDFNARWQPLVDADPALPQLVNVLFGKDMLNVLRLWLKLTPEQRALWLQANPQLWAMLQRFMRWFMAQQVGKTGAGVLLGSIPPNAPIPSATTVPPNAPYVPLPPAVPSAPAVANAGIPLPP